MPGKKNPKPRRRVPEWLGRNPTRVIEEYIDQIQGFKLAIRRQTTSLQEAEARVLAASKRGSSQKNIFGLAIAALQCRIALVNAQIGYGESRLSLDSFFRGLELMEPTKGRKLMPIITGRMSIWARQIERLGRKREKTQAARIRREMEKIKAANLALNARMQNATMEELKEMKKTLETNWKRISALLGKLYPKREQE